MARREAVIGSRVGLHARPAALFVKAATRTGLPVRIGRPEGTLLDARSMLGVLSLGAKNGDTVVVEAEGEGAGQALDSLVLLLQQDHDEPAAVDA